MKKLGTIAFIAFILFAGIYAILQSNIGRNFVRNLLVKNLEQSGFTAQIAHVEGTLPHQIEMKGITVQGKGIELRIDSLTLRPILWRFFKGEVAFSHIQAQHVVIDGMAPFDFAGKFRMNQKNIYLLGKIADWALRSRLNRKTNQAVFTVQHPFLNAKGQAKLNDSLELMDAKIQTRLSIENQISLLAHTQITKESEGFRVQTRWQVPDWELKGNADATLIGRKLIGLASADPYAKATFEVELDEKGILIGTSHLTLENLQSLHLPNLYGKMEINTEWSSIDGVQGLYLDATATDFYYGADFMAQRFSVYSDLADPFHQVKGLFDVVVEKGKWKDVEIDAANLEIRTGEDSYPFRFFADGKWKKPFELRMDGWGKDSFEAHIESAEGFFSHHPFTLAHPLHFIWHEDQLVLPEVEIAFERGSALFQIERQKEHVQSHLFFKQLPLDLFSPLDISLSGTVDLEAHIREEKTGLQGDLKTSIVQEAPFEAAGELLGHFDRDLLTLNGNFHVHNTPLLQLDLALPIHFSLWPFQAKVFSHKNIQGHIVLNGQIEEFLDFVDLGPHRLEGTCQCDLTLSNTLNRPRLEGSLNFTDGTYENYVTGTHLSQIQATCQAQKNILTLQSFTAQDLPGTGSLSAQGEWTLTKSDLFPFYVDLVIDNLQFTQIDLVSATANGNLHIEGNTTAATVKGDVQIAQSDFSIPDHIPYPLPNLQVVYKNAIHPIPPPEKESAKHLYPLYLDLQVTAPEAITIAGRGLSSEWSGDFHLGGTYSALAAKGKLQLVTGEFNFSNRSFKLTEGELSFSGREHDMPHINLAGSMETRGIVVIVRLHGPLNNPQITLQSTPPLPLGSIMSYLLFGQDLSEISGFQALQLATALANLAGTGADILESTRRSLGIDRLRILTDPTEEGGETVALQVGKYVSKGVLVSFKQGTEDSSPDISVEFELKGNLVFQIESDQHQEQGIFTLKWHHNY